MSLTSSSNLVEDKKLWEELLSLYYHQYPPGIPNREAKVLFQVIQDTFEGSGGGEDIQINPYLIHNLAACARIILEYDKDDHIPIDKLDHDAILCRTWNGFIQALNSDI